MIVSKPSTISCRPITSLTASTTPGMNDSRLVESWRIVRVSPGPPKITAWWATRPGSRTLWMVTPSTVPPRVPSTVSRWVAGRWNGSSRPCAILRAVVMAVPEGASTLPSWCISMSSTWSKKRAAAFARWAITTAPRAKLDAATAPSFRSRHSRSSSCRNASERPEGPIPSLAPASSASRATIGVYSAFVKSTTTSGRVRVNIAAGSAPKGTRPEPSGRERYSSPAMWERTPTGSSSGSALTAASTCRPIFPVPLTTTFMGMGVPSYVLPAPPGRAGRGRQGIAGAAPEGAARWTAAGRAAGAAPATESAATAGAASTATATGTASTGAAAGPAVTAAPARVPLAAATTATAGAASTATAAEVTARRPPAAVSLAAASTHSGHLGLLGGFPRLLKGHPLQDGAAGEVHPAQVIHLNHHHHNLVAHVDDVFGAPHGLLGQVRKANQAFLARQHLHEGAEGGEARDFARVYLAQLHVLGQPLDDGDRLAGLLFVG